MPTISKTDERIQFEPDVFWAQHGRKVIWAAVGVVAIGLIVFVVQHNAAQRMEEAAVRLSNASDAAALQSIVNDYPGREVAAQAMAKLADLQFRQGNFNDAAASYQRLIQSFPNNPLAESAQLGLAAIQEAQGNYQAARDSYMQILNTHPTGFTAQSARLGAARCSELLGQTKQAQQLYEEVAARESPLQREAYIRWVVLSRNRPAEPPAESATKAPAATPPLTLDPGANLQPPPPAAKP
jgi:tetratricopeptide (TPR) repeat protein